MKAEIPARPAASQEAPLAVVCRDCFGRSCAAGGHFARAGRQLLEFVDPDLHGDQAETVSAVDSSPEPRNGCKKMGGIERRLNRAGPPLELSADDLNGFLAGLPEAKITICSVPHCSRPTGGNSACLDKSGQRKLKGRYLNGLVRFNVSFTDGLLFMTAASVQANGKSIPKWILSVAAEEFASGPGQNMETQQLLQNVESIRSRMGRSRSHRRKSNERSFLGLASSLRPWTATPSCSKRESGSSWQNCSRDCGQEHSRLHQTVLSGIREQRRKGGDEVILEFQRGQIRQSTQRV